MENACDPTPTPAPNTAQRSGNETRQRCFHPVLLSCFYPSARFLRLMAWLPSPRVFFSALVPFWVISISNTSYRPEARIIPPSCSAQI